MTHNLSHDKNCVFYKTSIFLKMTAHARTLHRQKSPILATDKVTWDICSKKKKRSHGPWPYLFIYFLRHGLSFILS